MNDIQLLCRAITRFLDGDHTRAAVDEIERIVVERFTDEDFYFDLAESLSLYAPSSSHPYVNERELGGILKDFQQQFCKQDALP